LFFRRIGSLTAQSISTSLSDFDAPSNPEYRRRYGGFVWQNVAQARQIAMD
jgi:hypothetical protein